MLPIPLSTVLNSTHVGGNHAVETVQGWECKMVAYKKGVGALQEDGDLDDDIIPLSILEHRLDAITQTLSHLLLSDDNLKPLRSRFLLDQSIKTLMVLVGTRLPE